MAREHITSSSVRGESGQSLVVIVIAMTLIVLIAAFAIDVSLWFGKRHHAQVTADAAALAAANYMSNGGSAGTATTMATTYATSNSLPISSSDVSVDTSNDTVSVKVPTSGPLLFAGIALGSGPSISARAVASWALTDCASAGSGCAFMFGADNVCSGNTGVQAVTSSNGSGTGVVNHGVTIADSGTGSGTPITGAVISASNITTANINGNPLFNSAAAYQTGCSGPNPSSPSPFKAAYQRAVTNQFPIDYRKIYSACGTTSTKFGVVNCDGAGFPSYCTAADESTLANDPVNTIDSNAIYCDAGSGTKSDPSTWNGTITVTASGGNATYIAGTVDFSVPSNTTFGPASGNRLLAYGAECNASTPLPSTCPASGTSTTSPAVNLTSSGNATISGDMFAPAGVIDSNLGGTPSITGFLEGWDVVYIVNGTVTGQGPPVTSNVTFVGDYLTQ